MTGIWRRLPCVYLVMACAAVLPGQAAEPAEPVVSRVLFGSCIQQDRPMPILTTMLTTNPQLAIMLGDNIYADTSDMNVMQRKYDQLGATPEFIALRAACPILATWDDHDFGVNDGGAQFAQRDDAQKLFYDFWGEAVDSPKRKRAGVYDARVFGPTGKRLQVIMLDTRYFRSSLKRGPGRVGGPYIPDQDPEKTMLGEAQWDWLERQLRIPAELRVIGSSIQFVASSAGQEAWANLPLERQRLLDLIEQTHAGGVLVVSGDRHWAEFSQTNELTAYPLMEMTSSSLNQDHPRGTPTGNRFRAIETTYHEPNFGLLLIDWDLPDPQVTIEVRDLHDQTKIRKQLRLSDIHPAHPQ